LKKVELLDERDQMRERPAEASREAGDPVGIGALRMRGAVG
jgi:hypothetical protein